ncbi:MAG: hypothetical protein ABIR00_03930 [Nitrosospira sp.]
MTQLVRQQQPAAQRAIDEAAFPVASVTALPGLSAISSGLLTAVGLASITLWPYFFSALS